MQNKITTASLKTFVAALSFSLLSFPLMAQVGIGTLTPDASAQLDITSGSKGLLIPRMNASARGSITSPATGLMVYQTDAPTGFYYYDGSTWNMVGTSSLTGFCASISSAIVSTSATLTGWSTTSPFYNSGNFNTITGQFTTPSTGVYAITATINYKTTAPISISVGSGVNPYFEVTKTSPLPSSLLQAHLPILDVNIALILTLRTILSSSAVTLTGTIDLNAGDIIALGYNANGLTTSLNLGSSLVWSVTKIQ